MANRVTYKDVSRKAFNEIANLCDYDGGINPYFTHVSVEYNGNKLQGDMTIDVSAGESKIYKEMLQKVAEILSKY